MTIEALGGRKAVITLILVAAAVGLAALDKLSGDAATIILAAIATFNAANAAEHWAQKSGGAKNRAVLATNTAKEERANRKGGADDDAIAAP